MENVTKKTSLNKKERARGRQGREAGYEREHNSCYTRIWWGRTYPFQMRGRRGRRQTYTAEAVIAGGVIITNPASACACASLAATTHITNNNSSSSACSCSHQIVRVVALRRPEKDYGVEIHRNPLVQEQQQPKCRNEVDRSGQPGVGCRVRYSMHGCSGSLEIRRLIGGGTND